MLTKKIIFLACWIFTSVLGISQTPPADSLVIDAQTFMKVDEEAHFPGGETSWRSFLSKNLNPNVPVDNGAPIGKYTVIVQFIVLKTGYVAEVKALTRLGYGMEAEVVKLIKKSGLWSPAVMNKQPVNAYRKQPVTFMVTQEEFEITTKVPYVLFAGVDNELTIKADKIKSESLNVTISKGTIRMTEDGKFIARVSEPGRVVIGVFSKKGKQIANMSFEVKEQEAAQ
jgi:hypothetical protein